jgi:hypothetical protein
LEVIFLLPGGLKVCLGGKEGIVGPLFPSAPSSDGLNITFKAQSLKDRPDKAIFQVSLFSRAELEAANVMIGSGCRLKNPCG